jgi:putative membrane protein
MTLRWLVASLHLLGLAVGLGAILFRARLLRRIRSAEGLPDVFLADNLWALAALLWITTGLARAFAGLEKGTAYYLGQPLFWTKLALFLLVFLLELRPIVTLVRWRLALRRGAEVGLSAAPALAATSRVQAALVVVILLLATALARGLAP